MKIAIFSDLFLPAINGVSIHVLNTVNLLSKKGHNIVLFVPKPSHEFDTSLIPKNVEVHYLFSTSALIYPDLQITSPISLFVVNQIRKFQPDIVHFHSPATVGCNALIAAKFLNIPVVGTFHGYFMEPEYLRTVGLHKIKLDNSRTITRLGWMYSNMFYNQADIVIAPSKTTKQDLVANGLHRLIEVVSSGVDISHLTERPTISYDLPAKYYLYVGRLSNEKSIDLIIKAFQTFAKRNTDSHLVIVGDGPARAKLEALAGKESTDRIHFLGAIGNDKLVQSNIFHNAKAFVTASKSETLSISILEGIASGLPVIGARARALPEVIGQGGILCEPDSVEDFTRAFFDMEEHSEVYKQQIDMDQIKQHDLNYVCNRLEEIYKQLTGKQ